MPCFCPDRLTPEEIERLRRATGGDVRRRTAVLARYTDSSSSRSTLLRLARQRYQCERTQIT